MQLYKPPEAGEVDHADPHFRAKRRPCGRCGEEFTTTPRLEVFLRQMPSQSSCEEDSIAYLFDLWKEATGRRRIKQNRACLSFVHVLYF